MRDLIAKLQNAKLRKIPLGVTTGAFFHSLKLPPRSFPNVITPARTAKTMDSILDNKKAL